MTQDVIDISRQEPRFRCQDVGEPMQALSVLSEGSSFNGVKTDAVTEQGLQVVGIDIEGQDAVLTKGALNLLSVLCDNFAAQVPDLLAQRVAKQAQIASGQLPDFLPQTKSIRKAEWKVRGIPLDLADRRVEITGPVDRKSIVDALNARTSLFTADFEDSLLPSWPNVVEGLINLRDAISDDIEYVDPDTGERNKLNNQSAAVTCRVRGLHQFETNVEFNGASIPAALFDFALYFHNNYLQLLKKGSAPYFSISKLESHHEARWWAEIIAFVEERFCLQPGTIKCTCHIETLPAIFEMEEILFELRSNIVALHCGRWEDIFKDIPSLKKHNDTRLHANPFNEAGKRGLSTYSRLLVKACHKRGALAIGGMSTSTPVSMEGEGVIKAVLENTRSDLQQEARIGFDGTCVENIGLIDTAWAVFERYLGEGQVNQLHITRDVDGPIRAQDLLST